MSAIVFVGPTLAREEVGALLDAECWPPAAQGDIYRAALERPRAIGLIDGYFDGVPAVWHKEILWAMAEGIPVFGSASMGALRAAELCDFGMRGVGRIFEDYRDGRLEDDDEVAVLHAPAGLGFRALSEPMVSIRATLAKARQAAVLAAEGASLLAQCAKELNYRDRGWEKILAVGAGRGLGETAVDAFAAWLRDGRVDAKREDAVLMLRAMAAELAAAPAAARTDHAFERTHLWEGLTERVRTGLAAAGDVQLVLDELRLDRTRFEALRRRAELRELGLREARRRELSLGRAEVLEEISRNRAQHGLLRRRELDGWLEENESSEREYEELARESWLTRAGAELPPEALARNMVAELKWSGEFAALSRRARDKARALASARHLEGRLRGARPGDLGLVVWYFEEQLGEAVPADLDGYARELGLDGRLELYRVLEREYVYSAMREGPAEEDGAA